MEKTITYTVLPEEDGFTIKQLLKEKFPLSTRQISRAKFRDNGITVNGTRVTVRYMLHGGDQLVLRLETEDEGSHHLIPMEGPLDIVYEDEDLIVLNKPAGVVIHPSCGHYADSLANRLCAYYEKQGLHIVVRPIGRLDKDTSGLICFGKNGVAASILEKQRDQGRLSRKYLAICEGKPSPEKGTIEKPIGKSEEHEMKQVVREDGAYSKTDYQVLKSILKNENSDITTKNEFSLVALKLHTGRTHQIRVHLSYLGHPLVGDSLYGHGPLGSMNRTALHSHKLSGKHPFTGEPFSFTVPLPEDMKDFLS